MKHNTALLNALIAGVALLGIGLAVAAAFAWSNEDLLFLASLAALTVASEVMDFGSFGNSRVSISIVLICAAGVFTGLPGAVLIAGVAATADAAAHPKAAYKVVFNLGVLMATGAAYWAVTSVLVDAFDASDWTGRLGPSMAGAAAAYVVNSGFVTMAISMDKGLDPFSVWNERFRWLLPHYVVIGVLAVIMALAYDRYEMGGVALFLVPVAMAWLAMKQYAEGIVRMRVIPSGTTA